MIVVYIGDGKTENNAPHLINIERYMEVYYYMTDF